MTTTTVEFEIPAEPGAVRNVNVAAVSALDAALASAVPGAEVMHAIDVRRILAFAAGGPPVWSVAVASHPSGVHQFLTYGLSRAVDPASPFAFELSMRVRSSDRWPVWPTLLLRTLGRYHVSTGREVRPGEFIDLGAPISQAPVRAEERAAMPATRMNTVLVTPGATLQTPGGPVEIRNVFGLDARERELLESCRAARFVDELRRVDPSLTVDLDSPSLADHAPFRSAIEAAAAREGSDCKALCIPGLQWTDDGTAFVIRIPPGHGALLRRRLASRLPFEQGLLVHGAEPGPGTELLILPSRELGVPDVDASRLTLALPFDSAYVQMLGDDAAQWKLRYA